MKLSPRNSLRGLVAAFFLLSFTASAWPAAVWQWSVPVPSIAGRRAYLWVPPDCKHVRGLVIACHNMLEQPLFERPAFRAACAENGLGIVLIFSGHDSAEGDDQKNKTPTRSYLDIFLNPYFGAGGTGLGDENPQKAGQDLQKALDDLAAESGYSEIKYAPLMPVGHSSAGSFVWHISSWDPTRIFALMPFKTGVKNDGPQNIPTLMVNSEFFGFGDDPSKNVSTNPGELRNQEGARANGENSLYGYYVDVGSGHCNVSDDCIKIVSLWLKKAVAARIPLDAPLNAPVALKPVALDTGWLISIPSLGKTDGRAVAYADYEGDKKKAFWYLDKELANAIQDHMLAQYTKKPQQIGFIKDGVPLTNGTMYSFGPKFLDDSGTFKVQAAYIDHLDAASNLYPPGTKLEHSTAPIQYRVNSGGLVQVGPDTFRVCPRDGPLVPQGNPWEPTIVAYSLGDATFRPVDHPAHVNVSIINKGGQDQTISFPQIGDRQSTSLMPLPLTATASSGLPVEFYVASGPAVVQGNMLVFDRLPYRTKFPIRVRVSAFQWGRSDGTWVKSAGPVTQEFFIRR